MSDIASLLREAATYVGPCGDTELVEKLLAAAESLGEPVAWRAVGPSYTVVVTDPARATDSRWEPLYLAPQPAVPEGWITVKTPPKDGQRVLSIDKVGRIYSTLYRNGRFKLYGVSWDHEPVTHWMPLPEPPAGDSHHD